MNGRVYAGIRQLGYERIKVKAMSDQINKNVENSKMTDVAIIHGCELLILC